MTRKTRHHQGAVAGGTQATTDALSPPQATEEIEAYTHGHRAKPISFWPLDFETALEGLLAVKWPLKRKKKKKRTMPQPLPDYSERDK